MAITRAPWREHPCKVPICSGTGEIREERFIVLKHPAPEHEGHLNFLSAARAHKTDSYRTLRAAGV